MTAKEALALTNANRGPAPELPPAIIDSIKEATADGRTWCYVAGSLGFDYKESLKRSGYKLKEHKDAPWHFVVSWEGAE